MKLRKAPALAAEKIELEVPPIHRLPPELIAEILENAIRACWDPENYLWVTYTHVCCYWRTSSLLFPELWSRISTWNPEMMQILFKRSKAARLMIHIAVPDHITIRTRPSTRPSRDFLTLIAANIHRATIVECVLSYQSIKLLRRLGDMEAPNIEHFRLSFREGYYGDYTAQPKIFRNNLPRLKSLDMEFYELSGPPMVNLTSICLYIQPDWAKTSLSTFLDVIEQSPGLEYMALNGAGPRIEDSTPSRIIRLDKLQGLFLDYTMEYIDLIASHIAFPPTTAVCLTYQHMQAWPIPERISHILKHHDSSMKLYVRREIGSVVVSAVGGGAGPVVTRIAFDGGIEDDDHSFVAPVLLPLLQLSSASVTELTLDSDGRRYSAAILRSVYGKGTRMLDQQLVNFFQRLQMLSHVKLWSPHDLAEMLEALSTETDDGIVCPRLVDVELWCGQGKPIPRVKLVPMITKFIRERVVSGYPISRLVIVDEERNYPGLEVELKECTEVDYLVVVNVRSPFDFNYATWENQVETVVGLRDHYYNKRYRCFRDYVRYGRVPVGPFANVRSTLSPSLVSDV